MIDGATITSEGKVSHVETGLRDCVLPELLCHAGLVLLQMSEHSGLGGAFGSGMSSTVFGRDETKDPKRTATSILAGVFMFLGFILSVM